MSVAIDTHAALTYPTAGGSFTGSGSITLASYMTLGASATFLLILVEYESNNPGTVSVTWGSQSMTQIGSTVDVVAQVDTSGFMSLWGLVSPATGAQTLTITGTTGGALSAYVAGVSFNGSGTTSVAAATTGYASNLQTSGSSSTMTVTTAAAIPSTGVAVAWGIDSGNGFSSSPEVMWSTGTNLLDNSSAVGGNFANFSVNSGTGATMSVSAALSSTDNYGVQVTGILAPAAVATLVGSQPLLMT